MQIKRVDDKPMVIHVKEKPKLHTKGKREAQLKGRAVLTITKGPRMCGDKPPAFKSESSRGRLGIRSSITGQRQTTATPPLKIRPLGERVTDKRHGRLLKTAGAAGARKALSNMEGGEEVFEAGLLAEAATRPARRIAGLNRSEYRRNRIQQRQKKNIKQVKFGSSIQKREAVPGTAGIRRSFSAEQKAIAVKGKKTVKHTKDGAKGGNAGGSAVLAGMKAVSYTHLSFVSVNRRYRDDTGTIFRCGREETTSFKKGEKQSKGITHCGRTILVWQPD